MKVVDIIFALVLGRVVGFLVSDFLKEWGIAIGFYYSLIIWIALPFISLFCLWLAYLIGKKLRFVFQAAKFSLVGAAATVADLKLFELLFFLFPISILAKSISFIVSTLLKYWGNKYWSFQKHEKENIHKEIIALFIIDIVGLLLNVVSFYYFTEAMSPQFGLPMAIWLKLSVIFAALVTAVWNFSGYKFLVFKK